MQIYTKTVFEKTVSLLDFISKKFLRRPRSWEVNVCRRIRGGEGISRLFINRISSRTGRELLDAVITRYVYAIPIFMIFAGTRDPF